MQKASRPIPKFGPLDLKIWKPFCFFGPIDGPFYGMHCLLLTSIWNHIISKSNNFNENSCPQSYSNTIVEKHFFKEKLEPPDNNFRKRF